MQQGCYSKAIKAPASKKEGLLNFVQLIINRIEAGDTREALLTAADLLDTLSGNANPYAHLTDSVSRPAMNLELAAQANDHREAMSAHGEKMFAMGVAHAKAEMARQLGFAQ